MAHFLITFIPAFLAVTLGSGVSFYLHRAFYKADAWSEGYWQGVADHEMEIEVNEPGMRANRVNPYLDWRTRLPLSAADQWRASMGRYRSRRATRRVQPRRGQKRGGGYSSSRPISLLRPPETKRDPADDSVNEHVRQVLTEGNDAVRPSKGPIPCCRMHEPGRVCILPDRHWITDNQESP